MKHLLLTTFAFVLSLACIAQAPSSFKYQGVARDSDGEPISESNIGLRINLVQGGSSGNIVYSETFTVATSALGLFGLDIGTGNATSGTFDAIDWDNGPYFVKVDMDASGGSNYTTMGTSQLMSVPYSKFADRSAAAITADHAAAADHATLADNADMAEHATHADTAAYAVLSDRAAMADNATLADRATRADVADLADHADMADKSDTADYAHSAGNAVWSKTGSDIYFNSGKTYIGTSSAGTSLRHSLSVSSTGGGSTSRVGTYSLANGGTGSSVGWNRGLWGEAKGSDSLNIGVYGSVDSNTTNGWNFGLMGYSTDGDFNVGVFGVSNQGSTSSDNSSIGLYGVGEAATSVNIGAFGLSYSSGSEENQGVAARAYGSDSNVGLFALAGNTTSVDFCLGMYARAYAADNSYAGYFLASETNSTTNIAVYGSAANGTDNNYAGYFNGDVAYTGSLTNVSDKKLKKDISELNSGIEMIKALKPVSYGFRHEATEALNLPKGRHYGFLAQDVEKVIPHLVQNNTIVNPYKKGILNDKIGESNKAFSTEKNASEFSSYKSVNYIELIPVLTQAIKEQQAQIEELKKKVEELESKLD